MPTYKIRNKDTSEVFETVMKISELDQYKSDHPEMEILPYGNDNTISGREMKPDQGFRDLLGRMKKNNPRSNINDF